MPKLPRFVPLAALAALAATATPALAAPDTHRDGRDHSSHQTYDNGRNQQAGYGQANQIRRDIARLDSRIDRAQSNRNISAREANGMRQEVRELNRLYNRYARGGFTRSEVRTLEARVAQADRSLRLERRDGDRRRG